MLNLVELPDETLLQILEYLRLDDIKNVRLTCQRLYTLSLDKYITRNECLVLNERIFKGNGPSVVTALMATDRVFNVLCIQNDNYYLETELEEERLANVIAKFGENIKEVFYFKANAEFCRTFSSVVDFCPNLELISIRDCNDLFMQESFLFYNTYLLNVKVLRIYETQYLSDLIVSRLFALCPNLEQITISACGMNMHNGVYGKFYRDHPTDSFEPSNDVFNFKFLFRLLTEMSILTDLNLSYSNLTHKSVLKIFRLPNVQLRKLNLLSCREINWPRIITKDVFSLQTSITDLNLSHSMLVNDVVLMNISNTLFNLEILHLANCFALTNLGFSQIQNLKHLKEININNNHELTGEIISNLIECNLVSFRALHMTLNTEQIINYLTKFKLVNCEIGYLLKTTNFNDDAIKEINKTQIEMKKLHIHSFSITNAAFIGETNNDTEPFLEMLFMNSLRSGLENYDLQKNINVFRQIFQVDRAESEYSISNLRNLEELNLNCCNQITDQIFKCSMDLPSLRKLSLSSTKITFIGICYLVQKCPNLETLNLENTLINDAAVCILVQALPKLSNLSLKNCSKLTSLSYKLIAKHCLKLKALHGWNPLCHDDIHDVNSILSKIFNLPNMSKLFATKCMLYQDEEVKLLPYANHPFYENFVE